jgi:hypothetical protein
MKILKIREQKLQKSENKNYKILGTKIRKILEQEIQKSRNKKYKNPGTKIWETKLQKSGNKNRGTKI